MQEPTFAELLAVYRRAAKRPQSLKSLRVRIAARLRSFAERIRGTPSPSATATAAFAAERRAEVQLRILTDVPMAYWQAVYPDKLLQFKPLDGLRVDLITVVGLIAVLAQIRYESRLLEFLTLIPVVVTAVRSVLGYRRMSTRYENLVNDMIATKTIAQDEAAIDSLAASAAAQQFAAAAIAYSVVLRDASGEGLTAGEIRDSGEAALIAGGHVGVRFDAQAALSTLSMVGMVEVAGGKELNLGVPPTSVPGRRDSQMKSPARGSYEEGLAMAAELRGVQDPATARWVPTEAKVAQARLSKRWSELLEESVVITAAASARTAFVQWQASIDEDLKGA
jgi:hypothetical protein